MYAVSEVSYVLKQSTIHMRKGVFTHFIDKIKALHK